MSTRHEVEYKGRKITVTVSMTSTGTYVGTFGVEPTDPNLKGVGADSSSAEGALTSAQHHAIEAVDRLG